MPASPTLTMITWFPITDAKTAHEDGFVPRHDEPGGASPTLTMTTRFPITDAKTAHEDGFVPRHDERGNACLANVNHDDVVSTY